MNENLNHTIDEIYLGKDVPVSEHRAVKVNKKCYSRHSVEFSCRRPLALVILPHRKVPSVSIEYRAK
jgi:hypothetical protein